MSKGQTFVDKVWVGPKSPVLVIASSQNGPHATSAAGVEVRVNADKAIVRSSGQDVVNVRFDDQGPAISTAAEIVRLDGSSPFPQVVVRHFTGGAHCCTVMKVLTFVGNRWETIDVGEFDSEGPQIEDLNGDGAVELVGNDDSFDYAFASYAETYAPPKVFRLAGTRILNASHNPEFRRPILQMLLADQGLATADRWRDNGFLGGWVAHNALVGNGAEAWRRMLELYDQNSDWDPRCARRCRHRASGRDKPQFRLQQGPDAERNPNLSVAFGARCEGDEGCIVRRQTEEISALARAGAPVSLPTWVSAPAPAEPQTVNPSSPPAPEAARATDEPKPPAKQEDEITAGTGDAYDNAM